MASSPDDSRPPYLQAADALRQEIAAGRLKPGDRLPAARELEERFGIANMTVRSALRVLRDEGLIYSVQGRGSYVRQPAEPTPAADESDAAPQMHSAEFLELSGRLEELAEQVRTLSATLAQLLEKQDHLKP